MKISIFTHVHHLKQDESFYAYAPYVREINLWIKNFDQVEVLGPLVEKTEHGNDMPYCHQNLYLNKISPIAFTSVSNTIFSLLKLPRITWKILKSMSKADHIHIRCPGNVGLIACFCQIFFPDKPKTAKYAGNWDPEAQQPWTFRLQRWILSNTFLSRNINVLVYGEWPNQSDNIYSFFTASFSESEIAKVGLKDFSTSVVFLFVGNLVSGKDPLMAIQLFQELRTNGSWFNSTMEIYGNGPERERLQEYCELNGLDEVVSFKGARSLSDLKTAYNKSHFLLLPSKSEGWPKAIAEAMFFGCIPIATRVSCIPWMLGDGRRGFLLGDPSRNENHKCASDVPFDSFSETIVKFLKDEQYLSEMSQQAKKWSQQFTLEHFEEAIKKILMSKDETGWVDKGIGNSAE